MDINKEIILLENNALINLSTEEAEYLSGKAKNERYKLIENLKKLKNQRNSMKRIRKPKFETINNILIKKAKAYELLEEVELELKAMIKKYGETRLDYELPKDYEGPDGQQFAKIVLTDNIRKLNDGEEVYTHSRVKPVDADIQFLKRIPESLK